MRAVFADPKTDFVFKRIFGTEAHKSVLVALLDSLLELTPEHRIVDLQFFANKQHPPIEELRRSIVRVKCGDVAGHNFVVQLQVLNIEGFEKPAVSRGVKSYELLLHSATDYAALADQIGVTICDFEVWPTSEVGESPPVPMLSRWRMQEQRASALGLSQFHHVFLELPKYRGGETPTSLIDKWAYLFREAKNLDIIPLALSESPFRDTFEAARLGHWSAADVELYDRAKVAEQDARGALSLSRRLGREEGLEEGREEGLQKGRAEGREEGRLEGRQEGLAEGLRTAIPVAASLLGIALDSQAEAKLAAIGVEELEKLKATTETVAGPMALSGPRPRSARCSIQCK